MRFVFPEWGHLLDDTHTAHQREPFKNPDTRVKLVKKKKKNIREMCKCIHGVSNQFLSLSQNVHVDNDPFGLRVN